MNGLKLRRVGALFVFASLLGSIMVIGAPGALAHHPEVTAESRCAYTPVIDYVATSWSSGTKGQNANIGIYVNGVWQTSGSFTVANGYTFSGTIDASAWAGQTVTVMAKADGPWGNNNPAGDSRSTSVAVADGCQTTTTVQQTTTTTIPGTYVGGNPKCADLGYAVGVKSDPPGTDETIDGVAFDYDGLRSVTVTSAGATIQAVVVKGGDGAQVYTSNFVGLVAPLNNGGQRPDISHVEACIEKPQETTTTTEATTTTTYATTTTTQATTTTTEGPKDSLVRIHVGRCEEVYGESSTPVWVRIEPAGSATVTLRTPQGPIVFNESGSVRLGTGRYFWDAVAADGYELTGASEGSFRTAYCATSDTMVAVRIGECVYDAQTGLSRTVVDFRIAPGGTATMHVEGPGGPYDIDGSGERISLAPGTYSWTAQAADGYAMVGLSEGSFTIDDCSPECTAVVGDTVWLDMSPRNGLQDEGESGVEGVQVELLDSEGAVVATAYTDANGHYRFEDLCEGVYRVRFELPDLEGLVNETWTIRGAGDIALDSNSDVDGTTDSFTVTNGTEDLSWDAGVVGESVSPTTVATLPPETTSTTVLGTSTTTIAPSTTSTVAPATTTTVPPVTASTLPFTGFEIQATALLGLLVLAGGGMLLMAVGRRNDDGDDAESIGAW